MTIEELESAFWTITMGLLGYDTTDTTLLGKVRTDWPTQGQPGLNVGEDIVFLKVVPVDDAYNRVRSMTQLPVDSTGVTLNQTYTYTQVVNVAWICYGPNSNANAQTIRNKIFYSTATDLLDSYNLYLVTDTAEPQRMPEAYNNLWWERTDLTMKFNSLVTDINTVASVATVPININGNDYNIE